MKVRCNCPKRNVAAWLLEFTASDDNQSVGTGDKHSTSNKHPATPQTTDSKVISADRSRPKRCLPACPVFCSERQGFQLWKDRRRCRLPLVPPGGCPVVAKGNVRSSVAAHCRRGRRDQTPRRRGYGTTSAAQFGGGHFSGQASRHEETRTRTSDLGNRRLTLNCWPWKPSVCARLFQLRQGTRARMS
jgi:hypothetical protein